MKTELKELLIPLKMIWKHKLMTLAGVSLSFGNVFTALVLLLFSARLSRLLVRLITRRLIVPFVPNKSSQNTYQTFLFYGCLITFVALSLTIAGIPLTIFTVLGGALAIGVGFGSQNIVNNFISGIILLVEQPIKVGDVVQLDGIIGTVITIGTRSTKIRNGENKIFIVPNSFFLEKSVLNWTYSSTVLQTTVGFGVAYGTDTEKVRAICHEILESTPEIEHSSPPTILFKDFADSKLMFEVVFSCDIDKGTSLGGAQSLIRFKIDDAFKKHGIEMPQPQKEFAIKADHPIDIHLVT